MNRTSISYDEWRSALEEVARIAPDVIPPGWVSPEEMCGPGKLRKKGISWTQARHYLALLVEAGKAERKKFLVANNLGTVRAVFHYRLKK